MNITRTPLMLMVVFGLSLWAAACSFSVSTARIGELQMGKDPEMQQVSNTFAANDTIYSKVTIVTNPGTVSVKGRVHIVEVEGQTPGPIPWADKSINVPGSNWVTFNVTPPSDGLAPGKYKFEALMLNENGEQKDSKSQDFTVN